MYRTFCINIFGRMSNRKLTNNITDMIESQQFYRKKLSEAMGIPLKFHKPIKRKRYNRFQRFLMKIRLMKNPFNGRAVKGTFLVDEVGHWDMGEPLKGNW